MLKSIGCFLVLSIAAAGVNAAIEPAPEPAAQAVASTLQRVADRQIAHFRDTYSGRDKPHHIRDWTNGALYVGMLKWAEISGDGRYQAWLKNLAERGGWELHWRTYMADDHVVGQLYLDLYRRYRDARMLEKTRQRLDYIMANPSQEPIELGNYDHLERWTWCDALFMGPPVWAKMSAITGDTRYIDWMVEEFKATTDHLFDKKESLYYRDNNYIGKKQNGKKIFWSRGNGWVFAGLTLVMNELEPGSRHYRYFEQLYLKMAARLLEIQTAEGHWAMSLLDAESYPTPETSGTAFFTYGLAWGVNRELLKKRKYLPAIYRAWAALAGHVTADGMLGYVQPIGAEPGQAWPDKSEVYGTGAFLAAGSELYRLIKGPLPVAIAPSERLGEAIDIANRALDAENALFARFVPERKDDFAWENDLVAFRAYGPALRAGRENSGTDCWLKRVSYPVIDKWYRLALEHNQSYHQDRGEGYDPYHVGSSAGCGGTALWLNGKREPLETFVSWSDLSIAPDKLQFVLHYEKEVAGDSYREEKQVTLVSGLRLFKVESRFWKNGNVSARLPVSVGLTTHGGAATPTYRVPEGWVSAWEVIDGFGLGTGVIVAAGYKVTPRTVDANGDKDRGHGLLVTETDAEGRLIYYAGYAWERAGDIVNKDQWHRYLTVFARNTGH